MSEAIRCVLLLLLSVASFVLPLLRVTSQQKEPNHPHRVAYRALAQDREPGGAAPHQLQIPEHLQSRGNAESELAVDDCKER